MICESTGSYAVALVVIAASLVVSAWIVVALGRAMAPQKFSTTAVQG